MTLTSGNNQSGLPGVVLSLPLTVTATGSGGGPFPGARVTWAVTVGSAAVTPTVDTTDVNGVATTLVTVGVVPGNITVTATVTGVPAVSFQLTGLDPCTTRIVVPSDTSVTGVLTNFDCAVFDQGTGPYFTDVYSLSVATKTSVRISMNSATFDTYVDQYHSNGAFIAFNDDVDSTGTNLNTRYHIILGAGTYYIGASTIAPTRTGAYSLILAPFAETLSGCSDDLHRTWITRGVTISDQVLATDCTSTRTGGGPAYGDRVVIVLTPARGINATLVSAAFNPRLEVWEMVQSFGTVTPTFRAGADGVSGTATLAYTPPTVGAVYRLEMTSVDTVQTGAYTLTVAGTAPNVAHVVAPGASRLPERLNRPAKRQVGSN